MKTLHSLFHTFLLLTGYVHSLGINYGQVGNNLPPPETVIRLIQPLKITKTRIYDTNPLILSAFANSNVDLIVTVENQMLSTLTDPQQALNWVATRIKPYFPATNITGIAVGNEVFSDDDTSLSSYVVPAMVSIHAALVQLELDSFIHVSSPNSLGVMESSYPPSSGSFKPELAGVMFDFMSFLKSTNSPFWINAYPYFAYKDDPNTIPLDYVLFNVPNQGMIDPYTELKYDNMLYAQVDAVIFAIKRMGFEDLEVKVSETGWPSNGDPTETGANVLNAEVYNRNLFNRQMRNEGTPLRSNVKLDVYVFALFNEDMKPGPTSERNYGWFLPNGTFVYNLSIPNSDPDDDKTKSSADPKATKRRLYRSFLYCMLTYLIW